jgi:predicted RNase H-like HicB family nuclease
MTMATLRYMVVIERGETSWGAHVPDLPGCVAVGETREEVRRLIREAIKLHIDGLNSDGMPVPVPSSAGEFRDRAAAFRRKLAGRRHSDSTRLIRENRDR